MTNEQLDEIEKLAVDFKSAAFHDLMARQTIPLVKALREARAETDIAKAFHDVAVKERDYERVRGNRIEKERDEARAEATRQTERLMQSEELTDQLHKERNEARAEVERLRGVVRQVHGLVESAEHDYRALIPILDKLREIRKLTKEEP